MTRRRDEANGFFPADAPSRACPPKPEPTPRFSCREALDARSARLVPAYRTVAPAATRNLKRSESGCAVRSTNGTFARSAAREPPARSPRSARSPHRSPRRAWSSGQAHRPGCRLPASSTRAVHLQRAPALWRRGRTIALRSAPAGCWRFRRHEEVRRPDREAPQHRPSAHLTGRRETPVSARPRCPVRCGVEQEQGYDVKRDATRTDDLCSDSCAQQGRAPSARRPR